MQIHSILNHNNYNDYKSIPSNQIKKYNSVILSCGCDCMNISFKGYDYDYEAYKAARKNFDYKTFKEAIDKGANVNSRWSPPNDQYLYLLGVLIRNPSKSPDKYKAIELLLNHPRFESETLDYTSINHPLSTKEIAKRDDLKAYEMICDYQKKLKGEESYKTRMDKLTDAEAQLEERKRQLTEDEAALQKKEAALDETIKAKTDEINKIARAEADKKIKQQQDDLTAQQEEVKKAQQTLDKMIQDYQALHAEDLRYDRENLASGLMALYGINPPEKLPESINLGEQVIYVMDVLVPLQNKLKNINDDTPETITKAIQDDSKKISSEGLKFLERIINLSKDKCSEADLLDAIKSVKGNYGSFDMRKVTLFIRTLAWGNNTIQSSIKKVQQLAL